MICSMEARMIASHMKQYDCSAKMIASNTGMIAEIVAEFIACIYGSKCSINGAVRLN